MPAVSPAPLDPLALAWTPWRPLRDAWRSTAIPAVYGIYRIRRRGQEHLDYVGQTSGLTMNLRKRLSMLQGVYGPDIRASARRL